MFGDFTTGFGQMLAARNRRQKCWSSSARFRAAWISFAATGDPGWPAYDTERRLTQVFGVPSAVAAYPEETSRRLWEEHDFAPLPLLR